MGDSEHTLELVVEYFEEHELLLRLLGIAEREVVRHNAAVRAQNEKDVTRKTIDDKTRRAIDELVRIRILREEDQQDKRTLFPGELWSDRRSILRSRQDRESRSAGSGTSEYMPQPDSTVSPNQSDEN